MRRTRDDYARALAALLPSGIGWPRDASTTLQKVVAGLAGAWEYVDTHAGVLLENEADPRLTNEMLTDWERNWGLPDSCLSETLSLTERHKLLMQRMTLIGDQSRQFFFQVANDLGNQIDIVERLPFQFGISWFGDTRSPITHWPRWEIGPPELRYTWSVQILDQRITWWRFGSAEFGVDPHLRISFASDLECIIRRWKPAHTELFFDYSRLGQVFNPRIHINPGIFVIDWPLVNLRQTARIFADTAAYTVNGQPTGAVATARRLTAETAAYTINGQAATLRTSVRGHVDTAAYIVAGQNVTLRLSGHAMAAGTGAFVVSGGVQTTLRRISRSGADTATFVVNGGLQTILRRPFRVVIAGTGAFTVAGQAVSGRRTLRLVAGTAAYAVSGGLGTLVRVSHHVVVAGVSAYLVNGGLQTKLLAGHKVFPTETGAFTVAGQAVALRAAHRMVAGTAGINVNGQAATGRKTKLLTAATAAFQVTG